MPYQDGTGPLGRGARSRRGRGHGAGPAGADGCRGRRRGRGAGADGGRNTAWISGQFDGVQAAIHAFAARLIALNPGQGANGEAMTKAPLLSQFLVRGLRQS
jgi:hypothetical protein